ncbi:MAG: response regulator transcription factor [Bacteroidota bacterium]
MKINLLIVDDHMMFREGVRKIIMEDPDFEMVSEAENGLDAVIQAGINPPNVVIIDYDMPIYNGIYGIKELLKQQPGLPILLLSMFKDKEHIFEAINAGAKGFLNKMAKTQELIIATKAVYNGETWFKGEIAEIISSFVVDNAKGHMKLQTDDILTTREKEITSLFAEGFSAQEISAKLSISKQTVQVHKANIFKKLNLHNNTELLRYAIRNNMTKFA